MPSDSITGEEEEGWKIREESQSKDQEEDAWAGESPGSRWVCWYVEGVTIESDEK